MNKRNMGVLVVPLMISLCGSNSYAWGSQNTPGQNFVTGLCAVGAAVIAGVGAVAVADWCFSETDEQLCARFGRECTDFEYRYNDMMNYIERSLGVYTFPTDAAAIVRNAPEMVLYETATRIKNSGVSQGTYRSNVWSAKKALQSSMNTLCKRMHALERKHCNYEEQKRLQSIRTLFYRAEKLINHANFFADYLDHHKGYFNLYGIIYELRDSYSEAFAIVEQTGVYAEANLKNGIAGTYGGRYPFRTFVNTIESDISRLQSTINSLRYHYDTGKRYAQNTLNQLIWMKNVVTSDYRYAQECYQWEQERLQKLQLEAMEAQARAMREQNRILEHNNWLRQQELWRRNCDTDVKVIVHL